MKYAFTILIALLLTVSARGQASSPLETPELCKTRAGNTYRLYRDVSYSVSEGTQRLDVYQPTSYISNSNPAVLIIHGGGWAIGDKAGKREVEFARFMVDQGYTAVSINYTLTKYEGKPFTSKKIKGSWPQNITDCKSALRWMRKNSMTLGINPQRIAVMGGSAGGHLALLTGLTSDCDKLNMLGGNTDQDNSVRCIVDFYGIPDIRRWGGKYFIDEPEESNPSLWALASPVTHLVKTSPPTLVVHGTADPTVNIELSKEFVALLTEKGVPHKFVIVKDGVHSFGLCPPQDDLRPVVCKFLKEYLATP